VVACDSRDVEDSWAVLGLSLLRVARLMRLYRLLQVRWRRLDSLRAVGRSARASGVGHRAWRRATFHAKLRLVNVKQSHPSGGQAVTAAGGTGGWTCGFAMGYVKLLMPAASQAHMPWSHNAHKRKADRLRAAPRST